MVISKRTEEQRQQILEYVKSNGTCSNAEVCNLLGVKTSRARIIQGYRENVAGTKKSRSIRNG